MGDGAEQHEGSRWDLSIRDGLVEGKHRKVMGEAIWLYLYLHKHVGFSTGIMPQYRHDVAAAELELPLRTVKLHMDRLAKAGYVVVTRGWHCCQVEITRYKVPEGRQPLRSQVQPVASDSPSQVQDVAPDSDTAEGVKCNRLPSQVQQTARGTNTSVFNNKDVTTANAVGADAPPAAQNHTPAPPSEKPAKVTRPRPVLVKEQQPGVTWEGLPEDVAKVAAAWMGADSIRPQTALSEQITRYAAQAGRLLDHGHTAAHLVGCLRALAKMKRDTGKRWKVTPEMLADRVGQWQEQNGHAPDFFESNGHAGSNGAGSGPPWPSMPKGSIHDPETHAGREVFIAHFGKPPWMMSREEAIAAGVLDVYEKRRT